MKKVFFAFLLCFMCVLWAQKQAFTIEDLYKVKYVGEPQVSANGTVAFTITSFDLHKSERFTHIYTISDGKNCRQFTRSSSSEWQPRWSPDGRHLAFISNRQKGTQIWTIQADGGEARRVSSWSSGISDIAWSPNGKYIAFTSKVYPECGADDAANKKMCDIVKRGPVKAYMADGLLYRHWTSWKQGKCNHVLLLNVESGEIKDLTPGDFDSPPFQLGGQINYDFSPDSKQICFASNHDPNLACSTNSDLWTVALSGGKAHNISAKNLAYDAHPRYSPDGRYIAYHMQKIPGYESDLIRLVIYDRKTKKLRTIKGIDNWVEDFSWAPDSQSLYFKVEEQGYMPLYRAEISTGKVIPVIEKATINGFSLSKNYLFFTKRSVAEPAELYRSDLDGKNVLRLTSENDKLCREVDIRPAEQMWVTAEDGVKIHVFVIKPHGFDPNVKYPLILNVHGGPQSQWLDGFRGDWQVYPGAGYVVAFANPRGSTGYGQKFTAEISGDWGGKVFRDLMKVTDALAELPYVDKKRMGAMGWSFGGYMMAWFEGHTERFRAISCMMGVYDLPSMYGATEELWFVEWDMKGTPWESDLYRKWSPSSYVKDFKTPCMVITGMRDFRVPYTQSLQFFTALQKQKVPSRLIVFAKDGHWPDHLQSMPVYYNAHLEWFHKYLGGGPAPWKTKDMIRNKVFK